jgi:hypothetical protein
MDGRSGAASDGLQIAQTLSLELYAPNVKAAFARAQNNADRRGHSSVTAHGSSCWRVTDLERRAPYRKLHGHRPRGRNPGQDEHLRRAGGPALHLLRDVRPCEDDEARTEGRAGGSLGLDPDSSRARRGTRTRRLDAVTQVAHQASHAS